MKRLIHSFRALENTQNYIETENIYFNKQINKNKMMKKELEKIRA